jgi:hypothetical protein
MVPATPAHAETPKVFLTLGGVQDRISLGRLYVGLVPYRVPLNSGPLLNRLLGQYCTLASVLKVRLCFEILPTLGVLR